MKGENQQSSYKEDRNAPYKKENRYARDGDRHSKYDKYDKPDREDRYEDRRDTRQDRGGYNKYEKKAPSKYQKKGAGGNRTQHADDYVDDTPYFDFSEKPKDKKKEGEDDGEGSQKEVYDTLDDAEFQWDEKEY